MVSAEKPNVGGRRVGRYWGPLEIIKDLSDFPIGELALG